MSEIQRQNRVSSDFSIARILSEDSNINKNRQTFYNQYSSFRSDESLFSPTGSSEIGRISQGDIDRRNSISRIADNYVNNQRAYHSPFGNFRKSDNCSERISGVKSEREVESLNIVRNELSWLQCTRYRPPKLPRKSSNGKSGKRRPGTHPRIPFTANQLQVLEDKYRRTAYLSRRDVIQLSTALRLPQSRVKIWFQNRRARDRRESSGSNATILSSDLSSTDKAEDVADEKPMTPSLI